MFGSHLSIAGSMSNALLEAERLGLDTVQVFTKNQQQWKAKPLTAGAIAEWTVHARRLGWLCAEGPVSGADENSPGRAAGAGTPGRIVAHASYLINLASPDDTLWRRSVDLMQDEVERCEALGIAFLVHHPGSFTTSTLGGGLTRITAAYRELFRRTAGARVVSCLENTAGGGSTIGRSFEELGELRNLIADATGAAERIGFCLDTCHAHAAGYDLASAAGAREALAAFDHAAGLQHMRVLHVNDSKTPAGSRCDRHEHIGRGTIGLGPRGGAGLSGSGFAVVLQDARLRHIPKILETPKGTNPAGTPYDVLNLRRLKRLAAQADGTIQVPSAGGPRAVRGAAVGHAARPNGRRQVEQLQRP